MIVDWGFFNLKSEFMALRDNDTTSATFNK